MLVEAEKSWAAKGVIFIAVSVDGEKTRNTVPAFVERLGVRFSVWTGHQQMNSIYCEWGEGVPDTAFLDEKGVIVARVLGEIRREELDQRLAWLTGDRSAVRPPELVNHMEK